MPLPRDQLPARYAAFGDDIVLGRFQDNLERLRASSLDPGDDESDARRFGRVVGYYGRYSSDFADPPVRTTGFAATGVDVFADPASASRWIADEAHDQHRLIGRPAEVRVTAVTDVAVTGIAEEALAFVRRTTRGEDVTVLFRHGRLVGSVVLGPPGGDGRTAEAVTVARALDQRIASVLAAPSTAGS